METRLIDMTVVIVLPAVITMLSTILLCVIAALQCLNLQNW